MTKTELNEYLDANAVDHMMYNIYELKNQIETGVITTLEQLKINMTVL